VNIERRFNKNISSPIALITIDKNAGRAFVLLGENVEICRNGRNDRIGAYIIPVKGNEVGVVETPKGYFLLGGGLDANETDFQCIKRECLEESGYEVEIGEKVGSAETYMLHPTIGYFHPIQSYYVGKLLDKVKEPVEPDHVFKFVKFEDIENKMYLEMQRWAIEQAMAR
jgi:8-oxo-dGTP diphosphatase